VEIFKKMFGTKYKGMLALHKILTLQTDKLVEVLGFKNKDGDSEPP